MEPLSGPDLLLRSAGGSRRLDSRKAGTLWPSPTQMALAMPAWASQPASRIVPGMGTEPARGRLAQPLRVLHPAWCVVTMERHQQAPQCLGNTGWKGSSLLWGPGLGMLGCGLGEGPGEFWGSARHLGGGRSQNQPEPALPCRVRAPFSASSFSPAEEQLLSQCADRETEAQRGNHS